MLLRLGKQECFVHVWSERILDEMSRNLVEDEEGLAGPVDCYRASASARPARPGMPSLR